MLIFSFSYTLCIYYSTASPRESIASATTPDNTLATKAAATSRMTTIRLASTETPPNSMPANNVGMTTTKGWPMDLMFGYHDDHLCDRCSKYHQHSPQHLSVDESKYYRCHNYK